MKFERRNIVIRTMEVNDVEDYYFQFSQLSEIERKKRIKMMEEELSEMKSDITSTMILVVEEKDSNKLIGTIYGRRKQKGIEEISVSIPNESKLRKYGFEVIDQFVKICKEHWMDIKGVKLNRSPATEIYMKGRNVDKEYITVA